MFLNLFICELKLRMLCMLRGKLHGSKLFTPSLISWYWNTCKVVLNSAQGFVCCSVLSHVKQSMLCDYNDTFCWCCKHEKICYTIQLDEYHSYMFTIYKACCSVSLIPRITPSSPCWPFCMILDLSHCFIFQQGGTHSIFCLRTFHDRFSHHLINNT